MTQRWKVAISAPYARPCLDRYERILDAAGCDVVVACATERLEEDELLALLPGVHGLICGDDRLTARVLAAAPDLRVISKWGTGIDSIDVEAARRRGIVVCNTPNAFSEPVADSVMGYAIVFAGQLDCMNAHMHQGQWQKPQLRSLSEQTLGIVGVGHCGRAVARRAAAFGMRILGTDIVDIAAEVKRITARNGVDVVFEHVGAATWPKSLASMARIGRLVTCGATTGSDVKIEISHLFSKQQSLLGSFMGTMGELHTVLKFVFQKKVRPVMDRVFPLSDVAEAHRYLDDKEQFGKVVLVP